MRRYFVTYMPVAHLNGKLAPAADKCSNQPDTSISPVTFLYGYRRYDLRSRFAFRTKARNLSVKPYSQAETANKQRFAQAIAVAMANKSNWQYAQADFNRQRKYRTLYGFILSSIMANNNQWPQQWLPAQ